MNKNMEELKRAFEEFQRLPFPEDSDNNELSQLHAELAEYDGYISGLISTLIGGGKISATQLKFDKNMKIRLEQIMSKESLKTRSEAQLFLSYLNSLEKLVEQAKIHIG